MSARQTPLLLLAEPHDPLDFHLCSLRIWDRIAARVRAWSLDAGLAAGVAPDSSAMRAARARHLVDPRHRAALANYWERLIADPPRPPGRVAPPAPCRDRISRARPELEAMVELLRSPQPVPARGVAMARQLLTDGTGPVHNRRNPADVGEAARQAIHYLDPAAELLRAG